MIKIECKISKNNKVYYVLTINGTYVTFDVLTMAKAFKISPREVYLLSVGECIEYYERS